ncbi:ribonuclease P protein component [Candidatus Saganbacteria bacterium]|nr:ribonuclease P protein component [Candidatus Saganbacteria bacterium]
MKSITSKTDFQRIFKLGRRRVTSIGQIFVVPSNEYRIGIVVSGKIANAVKRNRIKRRLREAFRKFCFDAEIVIRPLATVDNLPFGEILGTIKGI